MSRRYGPIPWLILTSDEVQRETEDSFRKEEYFDVDPAQVYFIQQPSLPVLDASLNPVTNPDGSLRRYPTGHGGMIEALHRRQDILSKLDDQNIENIYCFIYPNVLESICDPVMLGYHVQGRFEFTTKGIPYHEYTPQEKLGRIVLADGTLRIVEYHEIQGMSGDDSYFWNTVPASMATHVWSVPFLKRCCCGEVTLPFHPIQRDGLWRVEQYAFDLLPHARSNGLVLVSRTDQYCPIKEPDDLPRARHALARLYRNRVKRRFGTWGDFLISDP